MRITSLVDNISHGACGAEHGLSLHIELDSGLKLLFDMGQGDLFARNAELLGIDLAEVDFAVISHGHYDHGGGLETFLEMNGKAKVYVRKKAFEAHHSLKEDGAKNIGLRAVDRKRLVFCEGCAEPAEGVILFANPPHHFPEPPGNALLLGPDGKPDTFAHEQSLLVLEGGKCVLFGGCAHRGIVNILHAAQTICDDGITHVFSGMHIGKGQVSQEYISGLAGALKAEGNIHYYTMHCTGEEGFDNLRELMGDRIEYLASGESIII